MYVPSFLYIIGSSIYFSPRTHAFLCNTKVNRERDKVIPEMPYYESDTKAHTVMTIQRMFVAENKLRHEV